MTLTPEQIAARLADRNPFATRSVRPGVVSFRFQNGTGLDQLVDRLRENSWIGEIIGPHGAGKSTLVQSLVPVLQRAGRQVKLFTMHDHESRLPIVGTDLQKWGPETQIVVDGYEQLGGWTRTILHRICTRQRCGLILTAHKPTGNPTLYEVKPDLPLVQAIVRDIQKRGEPRVTDADVAASFARHQGNVREVFFELYDIYEQRRSNREQ